MPPDNLLKSKGLMLPFLEYMAQGLTPRQIQRRLKEEHDVSYSLRGIRNRIQETREDPELVKAIEAGRIRIAKEQGDMVVGTVWTFMQQFRERLQDAIDADDLKAIKEHNKALIQWLDRAGRIGGVMGFESPGSSGPVVNTGPTYNFNSTHLHKVQVIIHDFLPHIPESHREAFLQRLEEVEVPDQVGTV